MEPWDVTRGNVYVCREDPVLCSFHHLEDRRFVLGTGVAFIAIPSPLITPTDLNKHTC